MAYGDGSATQLPSGKWRADKDFGLTAAGKRRRISATGRTEAEARRRLRQKEADLGGKKGASRRRLRNDKATVAKWAEEWLEARVQEVRPNTFSSDRAAVRHYIIPTIGEVQLVDVLPSDVKAVNRAVRAEGHDEKTVLRVQRVLVKMLRDALEENYSVPSSIFNIKVKKELRQPKPVREALELPQAVTVLAHAADLAHGSRWLVAFFQGMRQGECLGLTWDAVDFDNNVIKLEWQLQALPYVTPRDRKSGFRVPAGYEAKHLVERFHLVRPKTDKGWRHIPMVDEVREALLAWREVQPPNPHGLVWTRPDGRPIVKADDGEEFRALQKLAGVKHPSGRPFVSHEIRNTTATLLAELGIEPTIIQAILGHSSYAISQGYIKARRGPMMAAMEGIALAFKTKALPPAS